MAVGTTFSGPLISGPKFNEDANGPANTGLALLTQTAVITQNSTTPVSATFAIPKNTRIVTFIVDTSVAWDSATSAVLTIGTAAAGTQYVTSVDVKTAGRGTITFTAAQILAMVDTNTNTTVVATVTPTGATTAGTTYVTMQYVQTLDS